MKVTKVDTESEEAKKHLKLRGDAESGRGGRPEALAGLGQRLSAV